MENGKNKNIYIGFDFSMNKPAATVYCDGSVYFYFWAVKLSKSKIDKYHEFGVNAVSRELGPVVSKKVTENTQLVLIHTIRSVELANMILDDIDHLIHDTFGLADGEYSLYVCSEGLSYASKGDATLNLATYKGVLLGKIYEHFGDNLRRLYTYSPNTLKSTAGCATKELRGDKKNMIAAFMRESYDIPFIRGLKAGEFILKSNYMEGVDDIVDSYWAFRTMVSREKLKL